MAEKYEATLQEWLAKCDGDWECLARALFHDHPGVVAAREKEKRDLVALFGFGKPHRIRGKDLTAITGMLTRLAAIEVGRKGQRIYSSRKAALTGLSLTRRERDKWEKVLSIFSARQRRRRAEKPASCLEFDFDVDTD